MGIERYSLETRLSPASLTGDVKRGHNAEAEVEAKSSRPRPHVDISEYVDTCTGIGYPAEGAYSAPTNPLVGGERLAAPPQEPHPPALGHSGLASPTPTPKLVPTPLDTWRQCQ